MKSEGNNPEAVSMSRNGSGFVKAAKVFTNPSFDGHEEVDACMPSPKRASRSPDNGDEQQFGNRSTYHENGGKHKRVAELMGPGSGGGARNLDRHHSHQERVLDRQDSTGSEPVASAPSRSASLLNASLNVFRKAQPAATP
jgi:hypothetical protein